MMSCFLQRKARRQTPLVDERVDVLRPPGVEEDVALADAGLLEEQAGDEELLADPDRQLALVAREAARQVGELGVVAAPFAHAVEALEDASRDAPVGVGILLGPRD